MFRSEQPMEPRNGLLLLAAVSLIIILASGFNTRQAVDAFHLSFGHRLPLKSVNSPQLNPDSHLIRPVECRNANNHSEAGICMFSIDCMQNKGTPLSICKHKYFVGTCCRLPDYNNFVGIVYDLRDTETNHVLEAREVTPTISASASAPTSTTAQSSSSHREQTAAAASGKPTSPDNGLTMSARSTPKFIEASQQQATSAPPSLAPTKDPAGESLDGRYRISSTSLFGPTTAAPPASSPGKSSGESARDSGEGSATEASKLIELVNLLDLNTRLHLISSRTNSSIKQQEPSMRPAAGPSEHQKHVYEIVRDNSNLDPEVLGTFNSAHSPSNAILPASELPQSSQAPKLQPNIHGQHGESLVFEMSTPSEPSSRTSASTTTTTTTTTSAEPQPPTFNSAQGEVALVSRGPLPASSASTTSDQEFTLSSSSTSETSLQSASSTAAAAAISELASEQKQYMTTQPTGGLGLSSSSSVSDLVSSGAGTQATTPFTVSLSTALLPNISLHPYAPTQQPAATALVSSHNNNNQQQQHGQQATAAESLANFSQLYSNQHSSAEPPPPPPPATAHSSRPSLHSSLHAASKIVTGSSSSNNLIPGLSNLQSAILSHIPFKIASGLSSYLQAAMKPTGSKPLISSNTAPSLQYQQQQQQMANSSSRLPSTTTTLATAAPPKATLSQQQSTTPPVMMAPSIGGGGGGGGGVRFPVDNDLGPSSSSADRVVAGSTVSFPTTATSPAAAAAYDVVRESQRVCGRPQVQQQQHHHSSSSSASPLPEGVNKRMARIVGGNQSAFGQWPWMVSLRQWRKGAFLHKCGAALLNENWAITAAHCVEDVKVTDLLLRLGEFDVSNQDEPYPFLERRVKLVKSHPLFNPKTFEYDLALLRFAEPIKYERNIVPVCVPSGNDSYIDRMATVIGWGRLYEDGPLPDVIQHVDVPIITNNECEKMYKNAGYIEEIPDMFICAGISKGGRDSCEGDSGGPLTMVDHDGRSYLVGIISWGIGCALPSQPGVYTRITAFSGWINELAGS